MRTDKVQNKRGIVALVLGGGGRCRGAAKMVRDEKGSVRDGGASGGLVMLMSREVLKRNRQELEGWVRGACMYSTYYILYVRKKNSACLQKRAC